MSSIFWDDLQQDLQDPEFLREYVAQSVRISTVNRVVNGLTDALEAEQGLSKAELARRINAEPATIRRLLSKHGQNPTLGTIAEVAAALGFKITLAPLSTEERETVFAPLREGHLSEESTSSRVKELASMQAARA